MIIFANTLHYRRRSGFSLVEMIGVLAIVAILAVVIVPKVFSTIAASRVTSTVASVTTMKSAVTEFAAKYGTLPTTDDKSRLDDLLFTAGQLEGRFVSKIGTPPGSPPVAGATWTRTAGVWSATGGSDQTSQTRLVCVNAGTGTPSSSAGASFRLDGATNLPAGARVVSAVLVNVTGAEAQELSLRLDGEPYSESATTTADDQGKVVYAAPDNQGLTTAYVYVVHQ